MYAAMDVRVFLFVIARESVKNGSRLLGSGSVIQIDQLLSANVAREDRKIAPDFLNVKRGASRRRVYSRVRGRDFCSSGHPISSKFLPRSSCRATEASGFTEFAICSRCT